MTIPVFTNNASTTLDGAITNVATSITVVNASVFHSFVQNGAGATNDVHQLATLTDGTNIEIVKVTNANTTTEVLTVVRAQEGTTGFAFADGDDLEIRLTAGLLSTTIFNRADLVSAAPLGADAVDLAMLRSATSGAMGVKAVAIGAYADAQGIGGTSVGGYADGDGDYAVSLGYDSEAFHSYAMALGSGSVATGIGSIAIGRDAATNNTGDNNIAIGVSAICAGGTSDYQIAFGCGARCGVSNDAASSIAIGYQAYARDTNSIVIGQDINNYVAKTHMIGGPSAVGKDTGQTDELLHFAGQENVLFSQEYDFTLAAADNIITIEIPTGSTFFVSEIGFIPTVVDTRTVYPTLKFGSNAATAAIMTATAVSTETVRKRERFSETLNNTNWVSGADEVGHTTQLTVSVTVAATATSFSGRCYFKGMLLEDE